METQKTRPQIPFFFFKHNSIRKATEHIYEMIDL